MVFFADFHKHFPTWAHLSPASQSIGKERRESHGTPPTRASMSWEGEFLTKKVLHNYFNLPATTIMILITCKQGNPRASPFDFPPPQRHLLEPRRLLSGDHHDQGDLSLINGYNFNCGQKQDCSPRGQSWRSIEKKQICWHTWLPHHSALYARNLWKDPDTFTFIIFATMIIEI